MLCDHDVKSGTISYIHRIPKAIISVDEYNDRTDDPQI